MDTQKTHTIETPVKKKASFRNNAEKIPEKARIDLTPTYAPQSYKFSGFKYAPKPDIKDVPRAVALGKLIENNIENLLNIERSNAQLNHVRGMIVAQQAYPHSYGRTNAELQQLDASLRKEQMELRKLASEVEKEKSVLTRAIAAKKSSVVRGYPELTEKRVVSSNTSHGFSNPMVIRREAARYFLQKRYNLPEKQEEALKALLRTCILSQELVKNLICLIAILEDNIIDKDHKEYVPGAYFLIADDLRAIFPPNASDKIPQGRAAKYSTISSIISACIKENNPTPEMLAALRAVKDDPKKMHELLAVNNYVKAPLDAFREKNPRSKKGRN